MMLDQQVQIALNGRPGKAPIGLGDMNIRCVDLTQGKEFIGRKIIGQLSDTMDNFFILMIFWGRRYIGAGTILGILATGPIIEFTITKTKTALDRFSRKSQKNQ
jgi:hypothetical protein